MPRLLRNFKVRPAKFLYNNHLKYQATGTYTGQYCGPPVSDRRVENASRPSRASINYAPLLQDVLGSPPYKSESIQNLSARQGNSVFLFRHQRTKQVVYSLTGHFDPVYALPQLTFYGKKTIPEKYRRDDWRPYAAIRLQSHEEALLCYWYLRDLRMLRDYAWREKGSSAPPKNVRKKRNMDHSGSSVCDINTAIQKVYEVAAEGHTKLFVQWKIIEDLADQARCGGLSVLRKQISRAQRVINSRKKEKKFPTPESRAILEQQLKIWYATQSMMYKALAASEQVRKAKALGANASRHGMRSAGAKQSEVYNKHKDTLLPLLDELEHKSTSTALQSPSRIENPSFTQAFQITMDGNLHEMRDQMVVLAYNAQISGNESDAARVLSLDVLNHQSKNLNKASERTIAELRGRSEEPAKSIAIDDMSKISAEISDTTESLITNIEKGLQLVEEEEKLPEQSPTIFWQTLHDRKFVNVWPEYVTHMSMGARIIGDQYFNPDLSRLEKDNQELNEEVFTGNDGIDKDLVVRDYVKPDKPRVKPEPWSRLAVKAEEVEKTVEEDAVKEHYWKFLDSMAGPKQVQSKSTNQSQQPLPLREVSSSTAQEVRV